MTFHDLRSTGITWAAIRGDDALKIRSRSGLSPYQTMLLYVREAEVMHEDFGDVFRPFRTTWWGRLQWAKFGPMAQEAPQECRQNASVRGRI
jgi:hypothetical protein